MDLLSQKSIISFNITVISCAQTDCICCKGPYQSNCTTCRNGYKLMDDGVCVQVDSTNPFKTTQYIYITLPVICNIALSVVASFLDCPSEISHLVIYSNQTMLILLLISDAQSSNLTNFMSALQLVKLDLKFLDNILNLRHTINYVFYKEQYMNMHGLNFESRSTFANYSNALFVCFILLAIYFIALAIKCWEKKSEIDVLTKYINAHAKLNIYIAYVKLCFSIVLINCVSELMNQISLDDAHGDFKSYIFSDDLLIIAICCMFVSFDSKLSKSIFKNKSMHTKANLAKMLVYSFAFAFRNSWKYAKFCATGAEFFYLAYIMWCCEFAQVAYRIVMIIFYSVILLLNIFVCANIQIIYAESIKMQLVTTINVITLVLLLAQFLRICIDKLCLKKSFKKLE